jgi:hypothetical protein
MVLQQILLGLLLLPFLAACHPQYDFPEMEKFNGISCVAPPQPYPIWAFDSIVATNAEWVALLPYAFCDPDDPKVVYDLEWQWWGEKSQGIIQQINDAQAAGLKVFLKPHVWVKGQGWNGDFVCKKEADWNQWEVTYAKYILAYAKIADSLDVDMFCVGLEYRLCVVPRENFWRDLISDVREIYSGPITYAANWDNYKKVPFWDDLDFIGINSYFPLSEKDSPSIEELKKSFQPIKNEIENFAHKNKMHVLFTEYGFRSVNKAAGNQWELPGSHWGTGGSVNLQVQTNAYQALFETFWNEDWFAGGFLWNWHYDYKAGGHDDPDYTPQGKPVMEVIRKFYK